MEILIEFWQIASALYFLMIKVNIFGLIFRLISAFGYIYFVLSKKSIESISIWLKASSLSFYLFAALCAFYFLVYIAVLVRPQTASTRHFIYDLPGESLTWFTVIVLSALSIDLYCLRVIDRLKTTLSNENFI